MDVRGRRLLAVLAGGAVLIGGGVTTLASWQDTEYAKLPLTLSTFNVESSLDGVHWFDYESDQNVNTLAVTVAGSVSGALTPRGTVTTWVALRAAAHSMSADVSMKNIDVGTGLGMDKGILTAGAGGSPAISYEAVSGVGKTACEQSTLTGGSTLMPAGSRLAAATVSTSHFTLPRGTGDDPGDAVGVCFRLKLADDLNHVYGGARISPIWTFNATSEE